MKNILIAFLICFPHIKVFNQVNISNPDGFRYVNDPSLEYYFFISEKPVTNLDYLTYLCWINHVYIDYPAVFINAFPSINIDSLSSSQIEDLNDYVDIIKKLISYSDSNITNYLFNYRYINYPVLGLSQKQIHDFSKWLTDRYNEQYGIKKRVFSWDPNQVGEQSFSTESYLNGQYEGLVNRNIRDEKTKQFRRINWSDNYFIPTFRLPTHKELSILNKKIEFKEYEIFTFLKPWSKFFIKYNKNGLTLGNGSTSQLLLENYQPKNTNISMIPSIINEYTCTLSSVDNQPDLKSIYQNLGQTITDDDMILSAKKDSLGYFPVQIISVKNNKPIYATFPIKNGYQFPMAFRLVINELK